MSETRPGPFILRIPGQRPMRDRVNDWAVLDGVYKRVRAAGHDTLLICNEVTGVTYMGDPMTHPERLHSLSTCLHCTLAGAICQYHRVAR